METASKMFEPCRDDDHDDCAGDVYVDDGAGLIQCSCECHEPWGQDRAYAAGYAYASGYHD